MKIKEQLTGKRITVRSYQNSDLDFVGEIWFDKENGRYLSDPEKEYIDEKFQKAIDGLENSESGYYFVVELTETGESVGTCCAFPDPDDRGIYDIGYCVHKAYWRKGYGSEIVSVLLNWIKSIGGTRVTAEAAKENKASCTLLEKLGFEIVKEGNFKKYNMNICYDSLIYKKIL